MFFCIIGHSGVVWDDKNLPFSCHNCSTGFLSILGFFHQISYIFRVGPHSQFSLPSSFWISKWRQIFFPLSSFLFHGALWCYSQILFSSRGNINSYGSGYVFLFFLSFSQNFLSQEKLTQKKVNNLQLYKKKTFDTW